MILQAFLLNLAFYKSLKFWKYESVEIDKACIGLEEAVDTSAHIDLSNSNVYCFLDCLFFCCCYEKHFNLYCYSIF